MDFIFETKLVQTGPKTTVEAIEQDFHGISLEFLKNCKYGII